MRETVVNITEVLPVTIGSAASLSGGVNLGGLRLFGLVMPSVWTTAGITFQMSYDGGTTWANMYDVNGNEVVAAAGASRFIVLDPTQFASVQFLQIRSGTNAVPVAQAQASVVQLVLRAI